MSTITHLAYKVNKYFIVLQGYFGYFSLRGGGKILFINRLRFSILFYFIKSVFQAIYESGDCSPLILKTTNQP